MERKPFRDNLIERRHFDIEFGDDLQSIWQKLTLAQRFAATSLVKYGYELRFIRYSHKGSTAVLTSQNDAQATISEDGDINTNPDLQIRQ